MSPSIDELLALDLLTLREHTERSGAAFDVEKHRARLHESLILDALCFVRRDGKLVAYAMLRAESDSCWFVGSFGIHPLHRTYAVIAELLAKVGMVAEERGIRAFRSHVYKTNRLSVSFHRKLGFDVVRENDKAFEFFAELDKLARRPAIRRATSARTLSPDFAQSLGGPLEN
ncbi:GNAT family N-acetyltransferase [Trinickia diaoshuihuensis]|uniref:GNAT family N-acetyltransferase n=1 Tax=Trinickia diaoshuihuensis TaxID=2292265 RepID=UPI000E2869B4|nr:GNAT family N-acetyltransferase [Trinickia diaoshuihuensis]